MAITARRCRPRPSRWPLRAQRLLLLLLLPALAPLLLVRLLQGKEDRLRWRERFGHASCPRPPGPLLWFHAASVGELRSLQTLLAELAERMPGAPRLVTTGTRSSAQLAAQLAEPWSFIHQYVPLNLPGAVGRFLAHWQPVLSVFVESEFWPELVAAAPCPVLVNGRISDRSYRGYRRWRAWSGWLLGHFHLCLAQSRRDAARLRRLGYPQSRLHTLANLKGDSPPLPIVNEQLVSLRQGLARRQPILLASTHPGEEDLLISALAPLLRQRPELLLLVVPRHPQRGAQLQRLLQRQGWHPGLRSAGDLPTAPSPLYVADTLGELGLWIRLSRLVVIGGSFVKRGGQNPLEPARLGVPAVCGPWMGNFRALSRQLQQRGWLQQVPSATALPGLVQQHLEPGAVPHQRRSLEGFQGGSRQAAILLGQLLSGPRDITTEGQP